jgi:hypothetical protein
MAHTRKRTIPSRVTLCAIGYHVAIADNMVLFSYEPGVAGCFTRLMFERRCGCWYISVTSSSGLAMVAHIASAQELVDKWFGGDHEFENGENDL